jgi:hypothetical protein
MSDSLIRYFYCAVCKQVMKLDIARLIVSRLLVTAASGGGKSWLLRKILEGVSKATQTIVIDTEGEFATLREKRDMVLAGPGGEVPAEPRSAALLCRRLMELNLSAVIDVSELARHDKRAFVANFINTMVDLPRTLWRPCVVAVDETHEYAAGRQEDRERARRWRAGQQGPQARVLPARRDAAAAEARQGRRGGTEERLHRPDVPRRRPQARRRPLGFGKDRWPEIRDLSPPGHEGEFFCFGPALNHRGVTKFRAGQVETTHPKAGQGRMASPPEPSAKIRGVLDELKDLTRRGRAGDSRPGGGEETDRRTAAGVEDGAEECAGEHGSDERGRAFIRIEITNQT